MFSSKPPVADGRARLPADLGKRLSPSGQFISVAALGLVFVVALFWSLTGGSSPVGGLISVLCFSLFFWSRFLGGTAGWLEVTCKECLFAHSWNLRRLNFCASPPPVQPRVACGKATC